MPIEKSQKIRVYSREILFRLRAFKFFLSFFFVTAMLGGILISVKFDLPFLQSVYEAVSLMFFAGSLEFPNGEPILEIIWIAFPLLGLILLADGLTQIGVALKFGDPKSRAWNREVIRIKENHTVLIGIGNVGFKVLTELVNKNKNVVVIDKKDTEGREGEFEEFQRINRIPFVDGDATREKTLVEANIKSASSVLITIDDDLLNLKIALLIKKLNPKIKVVVRMFDLDFAKEIQEKLGIDEVLSTSTISIPFFIQALEKN